MSQAPDAINTLYEQDNVNYRPSLYFKLLLEMNRKDLNQSIKYTPTLIYTLQYIHTPIYFFVDKIDQAFSIDIHKTWQLKVCTTKKPENPIVLLTFPVASELFALCIIRVFAPKGGKNVFGSST